MEISEFRTKYPQYDSIDDEVLATKLYDKYYTDRISRDEFDQKFLGKQDKGLLGTIGDTIASGVGYVADAVKGDAAMDIGNLNDAGITGEGFGGRAKLAASGVFGSDDDMLESVRKQYPDATISKDENGNPYVTLPDGRQGYVNKPGLDGEDITRAAGKLLSFAPAAGIAGAAGKALGFGARVLAGGAGSAATDAVMQKAAGREDIDGGQVAVTGLLGAGSEALAPAIGRAVTGIQKRFGWDKFSKMSPADKERAMVIQLKKDGFKKGDLGGMTPEQAAKYAANRIEANGSVTPQASLGKDEFGFAYTRAQQMPKSTDAEKIARFKQMTVEESLFQKADKGQKLRNVRDQQLSRTGEVVEELADDLTTGGKAGRLPQEAGERLRNSVIKQHDSELKAIDEAYGSVGDAEISPEGVKSISDRVAARLAKKDIFMDKDLTGASRKLAKRLKKFDESTIEGLHNQRKVIDTYFGAAKNKQDAAQLKIIRDEYNAAMADATDNFLMSGDPDSFKKLREADSLFRSFAGRFRDDDFADGVIKKIIDKDLTAEDITTYMVGANGFSKSGAARIAKQFKSAVGEDSEAWDALREMTFLSVAKKDGEALTQKTLVNKLQSALDGKGNSLFTELYTPAERAKMRRAMSAIEATLKDPDFRATSGTTERAMRIANGILGDIPALKMLPGMLESLASKQSLKTPPRMVVPISMLPATGAYSTSQ